MDLLYGVRSIQLVREALGHVDIRTSLKYTHIDDSVLEAVENLSNQEEWEVTLRHPPKNKLN